MTTLEEWLKVALDAEENVAKAAGHGCGYIHEHNAGWVEVVLPEEHNCRPDYDMRHISTQSPRHVVDVFRVHRVLLMDHSGWHVCDDGRAGERWDDDLEDMVEDPCPVLRMLGWIHRHRKGWREEWAPEGWV